MVSNLLKIASRNIRKYKIYTLINVFGLAIGFTAFIIVGLFLDYEYGWDKHNTNYDRIYRVQRHFVKARYAMDGNDISPHSIGITAGVLSKKFPEIERTTIIKELDGLFLSSENTPIFYDNKEGISAEQSIFDIFTYHFIAGNKNNALSEPYSIALSETMSKKLFPLGNALNKTVLIEKKYNLKVTGIYRDLPLNSIIRPTYIVSLPTLEKNQEDVRNSTAGRYMTFVLLKPNQNVNTLNAKIWNVFSGYKDSENVKINLKPLARLHISFNDQKAYPKILSFFRLVGISILLLAAFNYINLTTAYTSVRAKEIGIRKVHGSNKSTVIAQLLCETTILTLIAVILAFFFTELLLPAFNTVVHKHLILSYSEQWPLILKLTGISLITGLCAGLYPAFFMANQKEVLLFKGDVLKAKYEHFSLKKLLVILQFSISTFLLIYTLIFTLQIKFLTNKNLGFNKENVLYATVNISNKKTCFDILRSSILEHKEIINCTMLKHAPFVSFGGNLINWEGCKPGDVVQIQNNIVSYDFVKNFGIKLMKGTDFQKEIPSQAGEVCLINETAMRNFGYDNPVGKRIKDGKLQIIGVLQDYHHKDMYNTIESVVLELAPDTIGPGRWTFTFHIVPEKMEAAKKIIQKEMEAVFPNDPFEVLLLSDTFRNDNLFKILHSVNNSLLFFTVLNILLAIIGLLGLVSFVTRRRTKEIGIRKINGSSSTEIFMMLTKEYIILLFYASLISWPCSYIAYIYLPGNYKVPMPYWLLAAATVGIILISLATSAYYTIKAAYSNPVEALRYE